MSHQAVDAVIQDSTARGAAFAAQLVYAHHHNRETGLTWLSLSTLQEEGRMSRPTAIKARDWLADHGELEQVDETRSRTPIFRIPAADRRYIDEGGKPVDQELRDATGPGKAS